MSVIWVPGKTSPYQKVAGPIGHAVSLNSNRRQAVVSGLDASAVPLKYLQSAPEGTQSIAPARNAEPSWRNKVSNRNPRRMDETGIMAQNTPI